MNSPENESALTFHWPHDRGFPFVLFLCVVGSLLAHAATFFLFRVAYPQRVTIPQPAPHLSLLTPSTPENVAFLRWVEAEDPALIAGDHSANLAIMPEVRYRPWYATPRTAPLGAPVEMTRMVRFPPAKDRLTMADSGPTPLPSPTASAPQPTMVSFSGALASRPVARHPTLDFRKPPTAPAGPTGLLVGVNGEGQVRHTFLQQSSGDSALDELAIDHLRDFVFAPSGAPITWGFAILVWGSDAYAKQNPKSE
jgi:hypothetical protein